MSSIILYIQPVYNYKYNKIVYAEALVREYKGIVGIANILRYVELNNIEYKFDMDVVQEALNIVSTLKLDYPISINLYSKTVENIGSSKHILNLIKRYKVQSEQVIIEINENTKFDDFITNENIKMLRDNNITIALDDFGTGKTNLLAIVNNKFDIIKIDRNFITEDKWELKKLILEAVIQISNKIGLSVTVEGIEDNKKLNEILEMNIYDIQGYLYSKPMILGEYISTFVLNIDKTD